MFEKKLIERIKGACRDSGYTNKHIALEAGISYGHLMKILNGTRDASPAVWKHIFRTVNFDPNKQKGWKIWQ